MTDETAIATTKKEQLAAQEQIIERGIKTFVEVGNALAVIRDEELYMTAGHYRFAAYCEEKWGFTRGRAYQLMDAAKVVNAMSTIVDTLPANEAQVRELAKLPDTESQAAMWKRLTKETGGNVTAIRVKEAVGRSVTRRVNREMMTGSAFRPDADRGRIDTETLGRGTKKWNAMMASTETGAPEPPKIARLLVTQGQGEPSRETEDKWEGRKTGEYYKTHEAPARRRILLAAAKDLRRWVEANGHNLASISETKDVPSGLRMFIAAIEDAATKYEDDPASP